jgi:hypothetical protein
VIAVRATMSGQDTDISNMGQGGEGAGKVGSAAASVAQVNLNDVLMLVLDAQVNCQPALQVAAVAGVMGT